MSLSAQIADWALAAGATHVGIVGREHFRVQPEVLASCQANACGKYGRCWTCPPLVSTPEAMAATLQRYTTGVLLQNIATLEDSWDLEGMEAAMKAHNDMVRHLGQHIRAAAPDVDVLPLGCGGCGYCARCPCPEEPCRFPEQAIGSVEGYGMNAQALVKSCGLRYINGANTVSYVGVLLLG
jgi:predicted metal-binding protein